MSESAGKAFDFKVVKKIVAYVKPYKGVFWAAFLLTILLAALTTARPLLIQVAIDDYVLQGLAKELLNITLVLVLLLVLESLFQFIFIYAANYLGQSIIRDIRVKLFKHLMSFRLPFFDRTPNGQLVTRTVSDIETIADIFSQGILTIFSDLLKIAVMIVAMFWVFDWRLVLVALSVVPVLYVATRWFQIAIKKTFTDVRNQVAALNSFVQEHISGMNVVQLFNREKAEMEKFQTINDRHRKANIRSIWYFSIFLPAIEILSAISIGLVVWYGGLRAAKGDNIELGELTAMILFINMLFRPLRQLADRFNTLQMGIVASERVLKLLDNQTDIEPDGNEDLPTTKGHIVFDNVIFGYNSDETILKGISFEAKPGETVAIVGATGAGKSTVASLILRFYPIWSGKITLDGKDISTLSKSALRQHFSLVLQDVFLFSGSIKNNITLGQDIDLQKIEEAAKAIGVHEFIEQLPEGYDYNVKERGGMLSSGQRQLLAFLRAYITNPAILILDEATSSVDSYTEAKIQQATDFITQGRTSIIIAHRLATIKKADKILVMDKGLVVEQGRHQELLEKGGYYTRLYEMQFSQEEAL